MGVKNVTGDVCGGKLNINNQRDVCRKTPECRSEYKRRYYADNKDKISKQRRAASMPIRRKRANAIGNTEKSVK